MVVEVASRRDQRQAIIQLHRLAFEHRLGLSGELSWSRLDELVVKVQYKKSSIPVRIPTIRGDRRISTASFDASTQLPATYSSVTSLSHIPATERAKLPISTIQTSDQLEVISETDPTSTITQTSSSAETTPYDLSSLYSLKGLLEDKLYADDPTEKDFIPDSTNTKILIGKDLSVREAMASVDVAARIGLETTGLNLPIAMLDTEVTDPMDVANPILVGDDNTFVNELLAQGMFTIPELAYDEGMVQSVPEAFGEYTALVVVGGGPAGTRKALTYMAECMPYLWETTRGKTTFKKIEGDVRNFFSVTSTVGQAAATLMQVDTFINEHRGENLGTVEITLYLEDAIAEFGNFVDARIENALVETDVHVNIVPMKSPDAILEGSYTLSWEVDDFWTIFDEVIAPEVDTSDAVTIDLQVSEPPEIRAMIEEELTAELEALTDQPVNVRVLSSYKLGYTWLTEEIAPALEGQDVDTITVFVNMNFKDQTMTPTFDLDTRWLHELFPGDEMVAQELGISKDDVVFENSTEIPKTYRVIAHNTAGDLIYEDDLQARWNTRPFIHTDLVPAGYFSGGEVVNPYVNPSTSWVTAKVGGDTIVDSRIRSDLERIWDTFQEEMMPQIWGFAEDAISQAGGDIDQASPFWRDLTFTISASEANYRIQNTQFNPYSEELMSPLEMLQEEIYFHILDFMELKGEYEYGTEIETPGATYPLVNQRLGQGTTFGFTLNSLASKVPKMEITWDSETEVTTFIGVTLQHEEEKELTPNFPYTSNRWPSTVRAIVQEGEDNVRHIGLHAPLTELAEIEKAGMMIDTLKTLHEYELFTNSLSWYRLNELGIYITADGESMKKTLPSVASAPTYDTTPPGAYPIVPYDHPLGNDEAHALMRELNKFDEINMWQSSYSYLGRKIYTLDVMKPIHADLWSQAKASTWKTTFYLSSCGHANEVSNTNAHLRMAELLARGETFNQYLDRVNFVFTPIKNPDGLDVVMDIATRHPTYMMHPGRYNFAGIDVDAADKEKWPAGMAKPRSCSKWMPDAVASDHGFPHHEWVMMFSGYVPKNFPSYWINRGTFWAGALNYPDSDAAPLIDDAMYATREYMIESLHTNDEIMEWIEICFEEYDKYGHQWDPETFPILRYNGVIYYMWDIPGDPWPSYDDLDGMNYYLRPIWYYTECADEVAWYKTMELTADAHALTDWGTTRVLYESEYHYEYIREGTNGNVYLAFRRDRPIDASAFAPFH